MNSLNIDWTINIGQIGSAIIVLLGIGAIYGSVKNKLESNSKAVETFQSSFTADVNGIQAELKELAKIVVSNAARDEREKSDRARLDRLERLIERLQDAKISHGATL